MNKDNVAYNFSAGPSMLPRDVMERVAENLTSCAGTDRSILEMSHRSKEFEGIIRGAEADLREIMGIPDNYSVMFLQGGGTLQFSMIALNLMGKTGKADYVVTGEFDKKAAAEAAKFGDVRIAASSEDSAFTCIPDVKREDFRVDADYVHFTFNNTMHGTRYSYVPDAGDVPLVCDMSSHMLSEEVDVTRFGLIYAGAQKNFGASGLTVVVARNDLLGHAPADAPTYLNYKIHADSGSMYNTPPSFAIYMAGEMLKRIKRDGGLSAVGRTNREKAGKLYACIDGSGLFRCPVAARDRSLMNVVFVTGDEGTDRRFTSEAREIGLYNLEGHRSMGGMRASIYNAMPVEGVDRLIAFMKEFEGRNEKSR